MFTIVASSREDAWIEITISHVYIAFILVASSREDAWIEIAKEVLRTIKACRVLPRGRVD